MELLTKLLFFFFKFFYIRIFLVNMLVMVFLYAMEITVSDHSVFGLFRRRFVIKMMQILQQPQEKGYRYVRFTQNFDFLMNRWLMLRPD